MWCGCIARSRGLLWSGLLGHSECLPDRRRCQQQPLLSSASCQPWQLAWAARRTLRPICLVGASVVFCFCFSAFVRVGAARALCPTSSVWSSSCCCSSWGAAAAGVGRSTGFVVLRSQLLPTSFSNRHIKDATAEYDTTLFHVMSTVVPFALMAPKPRELWLDSQIVLRFLAFLQQRHSKKMSKPVRTCCECRANRKRLT